MKLVSWNVNGIRALPHTLKATLDDLKADIVCIQETKTTKSSLDHQTGQVDGYNAYFSFSNVKLGYSGVAIFCRDPLIPIAAQSGLGNLSGSSEGTIYTQPLPEAMGFSEEELALVENEGRVVTVQFLLSASSHSCRLQQAFIEAQGDTKNTAVCNCKLSILSVYCPRPDIEKPERLLFKKRFHMLLAARVQQLILAGSHVVIAGDFNISHRQIDHCEPSSRNKPKLVSSASGSATTLSTTANRNNVTFSDALHKDFLYSPARHWLDTLLIHAQQDEELVVMRNDGKFHEDVDLWTTVVGETARRNVKFVDTFRYLHPNETEAYTCWCSKTGARQTNYGNRIDYILCDEALECHSPVASLDHLIASATVDANIVGSDHCPISTTLMLNSLRSSEKPPPLCSSYYPQFQSKQMKISDFFQKKTNQEPDRVAVNCGKKRTSVQAKLFDTKEWSMSVVSKKSIVASNETEGGESQLQRREITSVTTTAISAEWKAILSGPGKPPLCRGHKEPCVLRQVKKESLNKGRYFWTCPRPEGAPSNPEARCDTFIWKDKT